MRIVAAIGLAGVLCLIGVHGAGAVPANGLAVKESAAAASGVLQAQFYARHRRHYVVKCYRELVVGRYVCRRYYRW